MKYQERI